MEFEPHETPEELLHRVRNGSDGARGALLDLYRPYLYLLARVHIDRRIQAKLDDSDLVQDTVLQAHRNLTEFNGQTEAELTQWLRQIMVRVSIEKSRHYTRQRRDVRLEERLQGELNRSSMEIGRALVSPGSSPTQKAIRRERAVLLANALTELPPDYREVLILHELERLTISQVAQRMGRTEDSVRKLWTRALLKIC